MSNHEGGYLLNEVIEILDKAGVFELLGRERGQELIVRITRHAIVEHDCNAYEILESHGKRFGICHYCRSPAQGIEDGICAACRSQFSR
jgi:hypothetical protein